MPLSFNCIQNSMRKSSQNFNGNNNAFFILKYFLKLFFIFGIDINISHSSRSSLKTILLYSKLQIFIWICLCSLPLYDMYVLQRSEDTVKKEIQVCIIKLFININTFILWYALYKSRNEVSHLIKCALYLRNKYKYTTNEYFNTLCLICVILVQLISLICFLYPYDERKYKKAFSLLTLSFDSGELTLVLIVTVLTTVQNLSLYMFRASFVALYLILCHVMRKVIDMHTEKFLYRALPEDFTDKVIEDCFNSYSSIYWVFYRLEKSMSFPIFVALIITVVELSYGVIMLFDTSELYIYQNIFLFVQNFAAFLFRLYIAAKVHECDKEARHVNNQLLLKSIPVRGRNIIHVRVTFLSLNSGPAFVLSAWGLYYFTKDQTLKAIIYIVTYFCLAVIPKMNA